MTRQIRIQRVAVRTPVKHILRLICAACEECGAKSLQVWWLMPSSTLFFMKMDYLKIIPFMGSWISRLWIHLSRRAVAGKCYFTSRITYLRNRCTWGHPNTYTGTLRWYCSSCSHCFSIWVGNWDSVSTSQIFFKRCKWRQQRCATLAECSSAL